MHIRVKIMVYSMALLLVVFAPGCQNPSGKQTGTFLDEPVNPQPVNPAQNWDQLPRGLHMAWGNTNIRYHKDYIPETSEPETVELTGWRNERISAQLVLWASDTINRIEIHANRLTSANDYIDKQAIKHYYIRHHIADEFLKGCGPRETDPTIAHIVPDAFETLDVYAHPGKTTRTVWVSIDIPKNTPGGIYKGSISVKVNGKISKQLPMTLEVIDQVLPDWHDWSFHLDLWQNPYAVSRITDTETWSSGHFEAMKPLYTMLAEAGQKCITASITPEPWGGQTFDHYESMVSRTLKRDGSWHYDYSVFDKWVDFMMDLGINKQINCYSLIAWNELYDYFDEELNDQVLLKLVPGSAEYEAYWAPFLLDFSRHQQQRGILNITTIAMDERPAELMTPVIDMIKKYAPDLKITMASDLKNYASDDIHDLSIGLKHLENKEIIALRKEKNLITTVYVACQPEYPNTYTYSPPAESRWLGWFAYANGLDGVLRWAYNSWVEDPLQDTRFRRWPSGDAFLVYPGPRSGMRFEKLREGIQDFEKLRIVHEQLKKSDNQLHQALYTELSHILTYFKNNLPEETGITEMVEKAGRFLNKAASLLNNPKQLSAGQIIPTPLAYAESNGSYRFRDGFSFYSHNTDSLLDTYFLDAISKSMGYQASIKKSRSRKGIAFEVLDSPETAELGAEGYMLDVTQRAISIRARTSHGIFNGIQTLFQLLPPAFFRGVPDGNHHDWEARCVSITDKPRDTWRAFMLDSGRQYHTPEFIKRYLDLMALYKMNVFHWHLTENDGWRAEIAAYPELTKTGAFVATGEEQQGYYSRETMLDIVEYARARYINIMPEIDLPGHADAALTAYPEYSCLGKLPEKVEGHSPFLFCAGKEETYRFLEDVLDEICEIFPFQYIHTGGDEAMKEIWDICPNCQATIKREGLIDSHELQQYFSDKLAQYLIAKGRTPVFWEDVLYHGDIELPASTVIQWWNYRSRGDLGFRLATDRGHRVIASPNYYTYLNFPLTPWRGYHENRTFDMATAYLNNPAHLASSHPLVMGMTACLWTDFNLTSDLADQRVFPRLLALSEHMWNTKPLKPWFVFSASVNNQLERLNSLGIRYDTTGMAGF